MSRQETGQKQLANDKHVLEASALLLTRKRTTNIDEELIRVYLVNTVHIPYLPASTKQPGDAIT